MVVTIAPSCLRTEVLDGRRNTRSAIIYPLFQTPRNQAAGVGAAGLARPMPIIRVWYSLLRQAAIRNLTALRSNVSDYPLSGFLYRI